ncbi:hypothetical protein ACTXT7_009556 [Hymenolepis weldensis]
MDYSQPIININTQQNLDMKNVRKCVPELFPEHPEKQKKSYWRFQAYADSKLAQVIHARELARRLQGTGVCAVSLHPGTCATNILRIPIIRQQFAEHLCFGDGLSASVFPSHSGLRRVDDT